MEARIEDYCKILGLNPLKKDSYTDEDITKRINDCENMWKKGMYDSATMTVMKFRYGEYLALLPEIRRDMGSEVMRNEAFDSAKAVLERKSSKIRRHAIILHTGEVCIPPTVADEFAKKLSWEGIDGRTIINAANLINGSKPTTVSMVTQTAYEHLNAVGCFTPDEILNKILEYPEVELAINPVEPDCSHEDLRMILGTVLEKLLRMKSGRFNGIDAYIEALRTVKVCVDKDDKYDELFEYGKCMRHLKPALEQLEEDSGDQFNRSYIDNLLCEYVEKADVDTDLCIKILEDYCYRRHFPANFSQDDSGLGTCPHCKALINIGNGCEFCPECGSSVSSICPKCGTIQTASNSMCTSCASELEISIKQARELRDDIIKLAASGQFEKALPKLETLEVEFPKFKDLPATKTKMRESSDRMKMFIEQIHTLFQDANYATLKSTIEERRIDYPALFDRDDIKNRYDIAVDKVKEADQLCIQASGVPSDRAKELYIKASEICHDHKDAVDRLRQYPPEGPGEVEFQTSGDTVEMRYEVPEDRRGMTFCIYRGVGDYPVVEQSTKPYGESEDWTFTDKTVDPGVEYFYKIYSKRWGVLSEEFSQCGPAIVLGEVTNVKVETTEEGISIKYERPRGADRVRIWRKEYGYLAGDGDEDEIIHNDTGVVLDTGLKPGATYVYLVAAEYDVNGTTLRSVGLHYTGMTVALPDPVTDLSVRWDRRRSCYVAKWTADKENEVALYYSVSKNIEPGAILSAKDLATLMTRIEPFDEEGQFRFRLPDATAIYIYPAILVGKTAVVGKQFVVANLRPFRNLTKEVVNNHCKVMMEWPDDAEQAVMAITGKNDDGTVREYEMDVTRSEYDASRGIGFDLGGAIDTEIAVYAVYTIGEQTQRSIGVSAHIYSGTSNKIRYTVDKETDKNDRKKARVTVNFSCPDETIVPRCVMIVAEEGIPLRQSDGELVWESPEPVVLTNGEAEFSFIVDKGKADITKMRLFFPHTSDYNKYRFVHPLYNRRK